MKITVIGGGNIGGAIAKGALKSGVVAPGNVTVADPSPLPADKMRAGGLNVNYNADNSSAVSGADMVIVAVKPWLMEGVLSELAGVLDRKKQVVVSVAAGIPFSQLDGFLSVTMLGGIGVYRVVPNTAIAIGKSVTFIASHNTNAGQDAMVEELFKALGEVFMVEESQVTAVTALASCGIAYAFRYIDAAVKGGVEMGLDPDESMKIVIATVKGALAMLETDRLTPQEEIDKVTTPGGITLKGLEAMEKNGFTQAVINGLLASKF